MNGKENEILDRIFDLLDIASPEVFLRASKHRGISGHIKKALESFALEAIKRSDNNSKFHQYSSHTEVMRKRGTPKRSSGNYSRVHRENTEAEQISDILVNSKRFSGKAAIINFANSNKLQVDVSSKDSRARAAKKLAKAIVACPEPMKKKTLAMLYEMFGDQTRGWIDIIRTK